MMEPLESPSIKIHDDERENIFSIDKLADKSSDPLVQDSVAIEEEESVSSERPEKVDIEPETGFSDVKREVPILRNLLKATNKDLQESIDAPVEAHTQRTMVQDTDMEIAIKSEMSSKASITQQAVSMKGSAQSEGRPKSSNTQELESHDESSRIAIDSIVNASLLSAEES